MDPWKPVGAVVIGIILFGFGLTGVFGTMALYGFFFQPPGTRTAIIQWISDPAAVEAVWADWGEGRRVSGLALIGPFQVVCNIYALDPKDVKDRQKMATLGHEVLHCMKGKFHD